MFVSPAWSVPKACEKAGEPFSDPSEEPPGLGGPKLETTSGV